HRRTSEGRRRAIRKRRWCPRARRISGEGNRGCVRRRVGDRDAPCGRDGPKLARTRFLQGVSVSGGEACELLYPKKAFNTEDTKEHRGKLIPASFQTTVIPRSSATRNLLFDETGKQQTPRTPCRLRGSAASE